MADKPQANFDNHEQTNLTKQVEGAATDAMAGEVRKLQQNAEVRKTGDSRLTTTDIASAVDAFKDGAVPKTDAAQYKPYGATIAGMPEKGIGSREEAVAVVDYFKNRYPANYAFNASVEKAVFT